MFWQIVISRNADGGRSRQRSSVRKLVMPMGGEGGGKYSHAALRQAGCGVTDDKGQVKEKCVEGILKIFKKVKNKMG